MCPRRTILGRIAEAGVAAEIVRSDADALSPLRRSQGRALGARAHSGTIVLAAVLGLAVGIVVSVTTDVPFAPEAGIVLGWLWRRDMA